MCALVQMGLMGPARLPDLLINTSLPPCLSAPPTFSLSSTDVPSTIVFVFVCTQTRVCVCLFVCSIVCLCLCVSPPSLPAPPTFHFLQPQTHPSNTAGDPPLVNSSFFSLKYHFPRFLISFVCTTIKSFSMLCLRSFAAKLARLPPLSCLGYPPSHQPSRAA